MALRVQKFGGTSVSTPERIRQVADRIAAVHAEGHQLVVVVSAMGQSTDELISLAHQVAENPPHREMDMLLTAGERIAMALLSMALCERGVEALSFTGSQSGIITDSSHRRARIRRILGDRVRACFQSGKVAIVAGFQGVSETREITTLGRGGSDTTAVALAAAFGAESCEIFTDVDGVYSADPRRVPGAKLWRELPHDLMVELAMRGAGVLHPRCIELAKQHRVRVCVKNSLRMPQSREAAGQVGVQGSNECEGTTLVEKSVGMEDFNVAGVTADESKALLTIELMRPTVIGAVWDRAAEGHLQILAPQFSEGKVQFFAEKDAESDWVKALQQLAADGFIKDFRFDSGFVPLSVVGNRLGQDGAALYEIIETLARSGISVTMGSASSLAVTVAVPAASRDDGVKALHERFFAS